MKLKTSSPGKPPEAEGGVFLDANFLIALTNERDRCHAAAWDLLQELFREVVATGRSLCTSTRVLDEVWWKAAELICDETRGRGAWNRLSKSRRREALREASGDLAALMQGLELVGVVILGVPAETAAVALSLVSDPHESFEPADAFHLAVMRLHGLGTIVTNDADFRRASGVRVLRFEPPLSAT